jgi:hypothetical protein
VGQAVPEPIPGPSDLEIRPSWAEDLDPEVVAQVNAHREKDRQWEEVRHGRINRG